MPTEELVCEEEEEEEVIGAHAHFHLDMLVEQSKHNLKDIFTRNKLKINPTVMCLAFPNTSQWMEGNKVPDTAKHVTTGWHVTQASLYNEQRFDKVITTAAQESAIAIAEMGLDYY